MLIKGFFGHCVTIVDVEVLIGTLFLRLLEIVKSYENEEEEEEEELDEDYEEGEMFQSPEEKQAFTQQQQFQQQLPHDKVVEIKKEVPQDRSLKQQFYTGNSKFVFADKNAKLKGERKELTCDQCTFRCLTKALMASHSLTIHGLEGQSLASSYSRLES